MATLTTEELAGVKNNAEVLFDRQQILEAIDRMAAEITADSELDNPVLLCVMNGGILLTGKLLSRLKFPLRLDYVHVTRYHEQTSGTELRWIKTPEQSLKGRAVILVDDIFDEGLTLEALVDYCREQGATRVKSAVLVNKIRSRKCKMTPDYVGVDAPDRYLFGFGMDYKGYWRNSDVIYAVSNIT
ncbi:MAG: hypoxanthine-guanine phosphoribosyltransferase [bacterium]